MKTNVSEMEIVTGTCGTFSENAPLTQVSVASTSQRHPIGCVQSACIACPSATRPARNTTPTYARMNRGERLAGAGGAPASGGLSLI